MVALVYRCVVYFFFFFFSLFFFCQAEDGIRDLVRSRGLGDVYKRQIADQHGAVPATEEGPALIGEVVHGGEEALALRHAGRGLGLSLIHI